MNSKFFLLTSLPLLLLVSANFAQASGTTSKNDNVVTQAKSGYTVFASIPSKELIVDFGNTRPSLLQLIDNSGKVVLSKEKCSGNLVLQHNLKAGTYLLKITTENGESLEKHITIKE